MHERWHGSNHPETGWSLAVLATICMDVGKLDEAELLDKRALPIFRTYYDDSHDSVAAIRAHLASLLTKRGDQAALDQFRAESAVQIADALNRGADATSLHMALANTLRETGEWDAAIETYSRVIATKPDVAEARSGRGDCYLQLREFAKAADDYTAAIKLKAELSEAWTGRAFTYFHRQQWELAVADFTKAIELAPKVHTNWLHRGHANLQLAQWDQAAADLSNLLEQWPLTPK
jgi:tetratricopeptide (TPR) repeat protein